MNTPKVFSISPKVLTLGAVEGKECRANREKVPRKKGANAQVSGFGRARTLISTAVLINAGVRPHYCDRPPVTEFISIKNESYGKNTKKTGVMAWS